MKRCVVVVLALLPWGVFADETKDKAFKEVDIKGLMLKQAEVNFGKPLEITSEKELIKQFGEKDVVDKLKKEVDFDKQKLLFFAWSGSGQDKVMASLVGEGEKKEVVFAFKAGLTRDYRAHFRLFVIDKKVAYRIAK